MKKDRALRKLEAIEVVAGALGSQDVILDAVAAAYGQGEAMKMEILANLAKTRK